MLKIQKAFKKFTKGTAFFARGWPPNCASNIKRIETSISLKIVRKPKGGRLQLNRLNWLNISSEIWRQKKAKM